MDEKQIAAQLDNHIHACRLTWGPDMGAELLGLDSANKHYVDIGGLYLAALDKIDELLDAKETLESRVAELQILAQGLQNDLDDSANELGTALARVAELESCGTDMEMFIREHMSSKHNNPIEWGVEAPIRRVLTLWDALRSTDPTRAE